MDLSELRLHALQQASTDCRGPEGFQSEPEVITARAKSYLEFLINGMPAREPVSKPKAPKKHR